MTPVSSPSRHERSGFTLVEVLIVVTIIAITGAMALPRIKAATFDSDSGMRTVQAALQQAQRNAIVRQGDMMVSFDTAHKRIRIVYDANNNHQYDTGEEIRWRPLEPGDRFVTPPSGVQTAGGSPVVGTNLVNRDGMPTVTYHRDGALSGELEVFITSRQSATSDMRAIHVRQATGRVQAFRYTGSSWIKEGV